MSKGTLIWIAALVVGALAAGGSAVWLYVSGYEADLNPGGALSPAPWISLAVSGVVAVVATVVLLRTAVRSGRG